MTEENGRRLKLLALDGEDLTILSAHLQDAVLRVGDMAYSPAEKRFAAVLNRFDWVTAAKDCAARDAMMRRCRSAMRFERVLQAQVRNMDLRHGAKIAELLAVTYEQTDPPSGYVTLFFAGGGAIRLQVECIEAELCDLGSVWTTKSKPRHDDIEASS